MNRVGGMAGACIRKKGSAIQDQKSAAEEKQREVKQSADSSCKPVISI
jgi:hypothetical protein